MQPKRSALKSIAKISQKETNLFFSTPVAILFIACFVAVSFFAVFWGESFFARNIADARPMFEWMPLLLIFLCSALTMKLWSEERRTGTLEHVLASPVSTWHFVLGKFFACLRLLCCCLVITLPFPLAVSILGDLDWGPVFAGYLASFLLGAAYLAMGLFVSALSGNAITSLLSAIILSGFFYLLGSPVLTDFLPRRFGEKLRLLGTGSRFEDITRGVLDFRDLAYYFGLVIVFLSFNALVLEAQRWSESHKSQRQKDWKAVTLLLLCNVLALNLWLGHLSKLRVDLTEGQQYSLSQASVKQLQSLGEPLTIKAYFSQKTHPLLAPLVPQVMDLLQEYEAVSAGRVKVQFIDPQEDPKAEQEAKQEYGIEPIPFQVADRHEASILASYFNIVIKYGDSFEVLGFRDLIEVKAHAMDKLDVQLRNPEYDITRAIRKVRNNFQKEGDIFSSLPEPLKLQLLLSEKESLPEKLGEFRNVVISFAKKKAENSEGKLELEILDPDKDDRGKELVKKYGLSPMTTSIFDSNTFYFYPILSQGERRFQLPPDDLSEKSFERNFNAGLKRFATGFSKSVALSVDKGAGFSQLKAFLEEELQISDEDLTDGQVDGSAEVLLLLRAEALDAKELFAVDQFLMRGGTVIAALNPFKAEMGRQSLSMQKTETKALDWLGYFGLEMKPKLILDPQSAALPIPVTRYVGGFPVKEIRLIDYPYFPDMRKGGIAEHPALTDVSQVTAAWAAPIEVNEKKSETLTVQTLLESSKEAWLSSNLDVMPQIDEAGRSSFLPLGESRSHKLAVLASGEFSSYFKSDEGKKLLQEAEEIASKTVLSKSPESTKLIVLGSPSMFGDELIRLFGSMGAGDALGNLSLLANLIDWSTQDESLLGIRSRSHFKRTLYPMKKDKQMIFEYLIYGLSLLLLIVLALWQKSRMAAARKPFEELVRS